MIDMAGDSNIFGWLKSTQDWFRRTERSSGFRPFLIFILIYIGFIIFLLLFYSQVQAIARFIELSLYGVFGAFIVLFAFKSIQDPDFCRSEKHIENVRRLELMEEKGDSTPQIIDSVGVVITSNPNQPQIPNLNGGRQ